MTSMTNVEALLAATTRTADALERIEKLLQPKQAADAPVEPSPPASVDAEPVTLIDALVKLGWCKTKGDAVGLIISGNVRIDGIRVLESRNVQHGDYISCLERRALWPMNLRSNEGLLNSAPPPPAAWVKGTDARHGQPADNAAPWHGGNNAPNDWDGRTVWFRNGRRVESTRLHHSYSWQHGEHSGDIMWYSRSAPAAMTDADKIARLRKALQVIEANARNSSTIRAIAFNALEETV